MPRDSNATSPKARPYGRAATRPTATVAACRAEAEGEGGSALRGRRPRPPV